MSDNAAANQLLPSLGEPLLNIGPRYCLDSVTANYTLVAKSEGKSNRTIEIVLLAVKVFKGFLESCNWTSDIRDINSSVIRAFSVYLQNKHKFESHIYTPEQSGRLTMHTVSVYLRALSSFWSWLERERLIRDNPFQEIRLPKPPRKIIPHFSEDQMAKLFSAIDRNTPCGFRNFVIILLFFDTGIRCSELCSLKLQDVNLSLRRIKVWGKGAKERIVPIGSRTQKAIRRYLNFYRAEVRSPGNQELFLTDEGDPLRARRVQAIIQQYGVRAGITGVRLSPHTLRHTMAMFYLRNGGDVFTLQRVLGHASLQMTVRYVVLSQNDIDIVHRRSSPGDTLQIKC